MHSETMSEFQEECMKWREAKHALKREAKAEATGSRKWNLERALG